MNHVRTKLLMTRPEPDSQRFAAALQQRTSVLFDTVISPLIGVSFRSDLPDLENFAGVVFSSRHAVSAVRQSPLPSGLKAFTVGAATATAARLSGFEVVCADGNADDLVSLIIRERPQGRLVHLRGTHSHGDIASRLNNNGLDVSEAVVYDQPEIPLNAEARRILGGADPVVAPLFSPRSAALLAGYSVDAPLSVAAMSESVAKAAGSLHIRGVRIAMQPTHESMLAATDDVMREASLLVTRQKDV